MKRFKQMAAMLLFALLTAGFTSSAMASSGSGGPWILIFRVHGFFVSCTTPMSYNSRHPLESSAGINRSIGFQW
ncbi:salivary secreted protein [Salmonella enterica subsp. houtenae]|nr:salivary secreted protein [Salmonella enterica subsp. houtenae]